MLLACAAFAIAALWHTSVPGLRHDWGWPRTNVEVGSNLIERVSGWSPIGFGRPYAFLTGCYVDVLADALNYALGAHWSLTLFLFFIALLVGSGASRVADADSPAIGTAFALIAIFNPWTFNELVAGHLDMIVAFGATLHLVAELRHEHPRHFPLALAMVGAYVQFQFFVLDALLLLAFVSRVRNVVPYLTTAIVALPSVIGAFFSQFALNQIPILRSWQVSQSVPISKAVLLSGYAFGYANSMPVLTPYIVGVFVLVALCGVFGRGVQAAVPLVAVTLLVFISGFDGPAAPLYGFLLDHVKGIALFRELYDLVAYVLIVYLVLAARAIKKLPATGTLVIVLAPLFMASWMAGAPSRYWFDIASLPMLDFNAPSDTRFALIPPFQPLRAYGTGSGTDPDLFIHPEDVTPLNTYLPEFPGAPAFADWLENGDATFLRSLSVSRIVSRPWLATDNATLTRAFPAPKLGAHASGIERGEVTTLAPLAEISFEGEPQTVDLPPHPWENAIFFADLTTPEAPDFHVLQPSIDSSDFSSQWVNARLLFAGHPELSQSFGGVATSSQQLFPVDARKQLLVRIHGKLSNENGTLLSGDTSGFRWIALPAGTAYVRCQGECLLIAQGEPPAIKTPARSNVLQARAAGSAILPWLMTATLPPDATGTLRLNVAFAPWWLALDGLHALPHVRIDAIANGWLVPAAQTERRVTILYLPAALQFITEILGWIWLIVIVIQVAGVRRSRS